MSQSRDRKWLLEPCAVKVARTVLRGGRPGDGPPLPDCLAARPEVVAMLGTDEYGTIKADYDRISREFFEVHPTNACFVSWMPRIFSLKKA